MKTKLMTLLLAAAFIAAFICLNGCSDDDSGTNTDVNDLFGAWDQTSVTINGEAASLAEVLEWDSQTVRGRIIFYSAYTYAAYEYSATDSAVYTESGTFETDDSWLILTASTVNDSTVTPHQSYNGQWSTDGSILTLTQTVGTDTMVLTLTKSQ